MTIDKTIELRLAETAFMQATQTIIVERINWDFCLQIKELLEDGVPKFEAFQRVIKKHRYHLIPLYNDPKNLKILKDVLNR